MAGIMTSRQCGSRYKIRDCLIFMWNREKHSANYYTNMLARVGAASAHNGGGSIATGHR